MRSAAVHALRCSPCAPLSTTVHCDPPQSMGSLHCASVHTLTLAPAVCPLQSLRSTAVSALYCSTGTPLTTAVPALHCSTCTPLQSLYSCSLCAPLPQRLLCLCAPLPQRQYLYGALIIVDAVDDFHCCCVGLSCCINLRWTLTQANYGPRLDSLPTSYYT